MRCRKICNTDELQSLKLARNFQELAEKLQYNLHTYSHNGTRKQNPIPSYLNAQCLLRSTLTKKELAHVCHNKNTQQMSGGRSATITITMTATTTTMAGNVAGAAAGERGGRAGAVAEAACALNLENGDDAGIVVD